MTVMQTAHGESALAGADRGGAIRIAYVCADRDLPVFGTRAASAHVQGVVRALRRRGAVVAILARQTGGGPPADLRDVPVRIVEPASEAAGDIGGAVRSALERLGPLDAVVERHRPGCAAAMSFAQENGVPGLLEVSGPDEHPGDELGRAAWVLAASERIASWCRAAGAPPRRVRVVPEGVDPGRFPRRPGGGARAGAFTSGFVGDLTPHQGVETMIEALALLAPVSSDHRLVIVGDGPEGGALRRCAEALGVAARVRFAGPAHASSIPAILARVDVAVAPYHPGSGHASTLRLYEYMAAALPVVASRISDVTDVLHDGRTGLLTPPGDPQALAIRLERLRRDPPLARSLGEAARRLVERDHTWDRVAERILDLVSPEGVHRRH